MRLFRVHCAVLNARTGTPGLSRSQRYGGHGERETPGHIPNPEAKPLSADGTALETGWESRTPPDNHSKRGSEPSALALVCVCPVPAVVDFQRLKSKMRRQSKRYPAVMTSPRRGSDGARGNRGTGQGGGPARSGGPRG